MSKTLISQEKTETLSPEISPKSVISPEYKVLWLKVLELLAKKLRKPSFETWIKPTQLQEIKNDEAVIAVKNEFTRNLYYRPIKKKYKKHLKKLKLSQLLFVSSLTLNLNLNIKQNKQALLNYSLKLNQVSKLNQSLTANLALLI